MLHRSENSELKTQVETWKKKLTAAELANGKKLYCSGPTKKTESSTPLAAEKPAEEVQKKEDKPKGKEENKPGKAKGEKKEKPPKEKKEVKKEDEAPVDIGRLDLRVGHIRKKVLICTI